MEVICDSIGSVESHSNAPGTECSMCGAAKPHDDRSCEPCPWNPAAKCIPVADEDPANVLAPKDPETEVYYGRNRDYEYKVVFGCVIGIVVLAIISLLLA